MESVTGSLLLPSWKFKYGGPFPATSGSCGRAFGAVTVYFGSGDSPVFALKHFDKLEDFFFLTVLLFSSFKCRFCYPGIALFSCTIHSLLNELNMRCKCVHG